MNKWIKFIDSCVGNIARKIQDEFDESKHPRDKGGKFTSKGGEGRGGGKEGKLVRTHKAGNITPERADALNEAAVALEEQGVPVQKILKMSNEGDLEGMQKLLKGGSKSSSSGSMKTTVQAGGDTEGLEEEATEYGVKASIGESSHGETTVELSGNKEDIQRYLEEKFYGSEDDAREFNPEVYEEDDEQTSAKTPNRQAVEELIDTAAEGFYQNLSVVPKFVKQMGYKYSRGEKSYYEQYPRELVDVALDLIEKDPYKAHEVLGPWVDHIDLDESN